jgi:hypothetical protein
MRHRVRSLAVCAVMALALLPASNGSAHPGTVRSHPIRLTEASGGTRGPLTGAAARAARGELLSNDPAALARAKTASAARVPAAAPPVIGPRDPVASVTADGIPNDGTSTPSDSTGAIGPHGYIETVNSRVGFFDRSLAQTNIDSLTHWWKSGTADVFDPQVIWDPTTKRFYYTGDEVFNANDNRLAFGFSKTASPANATTDWCHYNVSYGAEFPDYPKLGDSKSFAIIGVNVFDGNNYRGSDVLAISKPKAGTTCPNASTFKVGVGQNLKVNRRKFFTPVPANEIDTKPTGYVLAEDGALPSTKLGVFTVKKNRSTGFPVIQVSGQPIAVGSYDIPPNAPESGSAFLLDTMDARLTQAVGATDPLQGAFAVWTQHTVAGGAGSQVAWDEVDPAARTVLQSGTISDGSLFVFNGAISPDRVVDGSTKAFGGNMVAGFTTSSSATFPAIAMVSKIGSGAVSPIVSVKTSAGPDVDFACPGLGYCRWGDYSAATPDPKAPVLGSTGLVWLTNMYTADSGTTGGTSGVSWLTWNWEATP